MKVGQILYNRADIKQTRNEYEILNGKPHAKEARSQDVHGEGKGKVIPLEARCGPEGG